MGQDIELGLDTEDDERPKGIRRLVSLLRELFQGSRLGFYAINIGVALLMSLIVLLILFAFPPTSTKIMLLLGEKLGVMAFWTLADTYPAAVSIVVAEVVVCSFILLIVGHYTIGTGLRFVRFCQSPPSLADLLEQDKKTFGQTQNPDNCSTVPNRADKALVKRVRFFDEEQGYTIASESSNATSTEYEQSSP